MRISKLRFYFGGLVAFLIGVPLTERALAGTGDVIAASFDLFGAISDSAGKS
jgi:hypothetical protein